MKLAYNKLRITYLSGLYVLSLQNIKKLRTKVEELEQTLQKLRDVRPRPPQEELLQLV